MSQPSLKQIADVFVRYANFTLGGGSATTAVIHEEIVGRRHWVSEEQFALSFALGRLTPGTNVLAFCTGIGWILRRGWGAVVALLAASIPCTLIVVAITMLFSKWQENHYAQAAIKGAIAAAVAHHREDSLDNRASALQSGQPSSRRAHWHERDPAQCCGRHFSD
jgi:chromate transporter